MDTNDPFTMECAFKQRVLRTLPVPEAGFLEDFRAFVKRYLAANVPRVRAKPFEEWLESTSYNTARKDQLRKAYADLRGGAPTKHQCSHIDTFGKSEFYMLWKHLRMINSRSDAFKVWSGPRFKAIEDVVYALSGDIRFIKHTPVPLRPALIRQMKVAGQHYLQTDFTAFESHFTPEFLDVCECELYRWCLADDLEAELLCSTLMGSNRMRTRNGVRACVQGRRMSGDMCTSLGNGFTNMMLALYLANKRGGKIHGYVEGDDGIFASSVVLTTEDYAKCGFTIKIEEVPDPCKASFCGMIFAESGEIVKDPFKFMQGFGWTQSFVQAGPKIMDELLRAKALSCVYETPQCPIVGAFARYALAKTSSVHPRFGTESARTDGYHPLPDVAHVPAFCPSPDTRELFRELFGITVEGQICIEGLVMQGRFDEVAQLIPAHPDVLQYTKMYVVVD
jgi:hypothetical protein